MTKLHGSQLSLITELGTEESKVGDWHYDELGTEESLVPNLNPPKLGTKEISVPNLNPPKLGTKEISVPNLNPPELGTKEISVPNFSPVELGTDKWTPPDYDNWKPPIGCLDRKWIKSYQYWCWRYYDHSGKKRAIHLHKDYNKAVRKAMKIGVPTDAKLPFLPPSDPQTQSISSTTDNLIDLAPTANRTSRPPRAA
jgi:hypothetical protein